MSSGVSMSEFEAAVDAFFDATGPLARLGSVGARAYEARPQQHEMAVTVAAHLEAGNHLCIEAPTGIGKTFAYLVPALLLARARQAPVVVSTHTISLQEQILDRDLPLLLPLLDPDSTLVTAIAKGRGNYICRRRLDAVAESTDEDLPDLSLRPQLEVLRSWAATTADGSLANLSTEPPAALWNAVCCETGNCLGSQCQHGRRCFLRRARQQLSRAQLIVANHALLFTELAVREREQRADAGILPAFTALVLDEGQTIEDCAAQHLGFHLTAYGLRRLLRRLYYPVRQRGLLAATEVAAAARDAVTRALDRADLFFERLGTWLDEQAPGPVRYAHPGTIPNLLGQPLDDVERELDDLATTEEDEDRRAELAAVRAQLHEAGAGLDAFLRMCLPDHVYWFEHKPSGQRRLSLHAVPVEVRDLLRQQLFDRDFTVIVTSATLAVNGSLDYFKARIGADCAGGAVLSSPFDFERQVTLYLPMDIPSPKDEARFLPVACGHIRTFLLQTGGKAFVLFTSYRMMHAAAAELEVFFAESGLPLFVQGAGIPRSQMLAAFRADTNSVIFGTASFWTGVDVPGDALSNVIIVRLPFAVPDHPLIAARQELIESRGQRAFREYALPEAILRFRQGFGRLIRHRDDQGIVVVLDRRILHTGYGQAFLNSIPVCQRQVF